MTLPDRIIPSRTRVGKYRGRQPLSLSTCHISPPLALRVARGGSLVQLRGVGLPPPTDAAPPRGDILAFSLKSRRRALELFASIDRRKVEWKPIFVTLTYPAGWPIFPRTWKAHLDTYCKRLERAYPDAAIFWRMEYQERGAPHFHLLVFNVKWLPLAHWRSAWQELAGPWGPMHRTQGFHVARCRNWNDAAGYVAKYIAKPEQLPNINERVKAGRFWGIRRRRNLPFTITEVELCPTQFHRIRRMTRTLAARTHQGNRRPRARWQGGWVNAGETTAKRILETLAGCPCQFHTASTHGSALRVRRIGVITSPHSTPPSQDVKRCAEIWAR